MGKRIDIGKEVLRRGRADDVPVLAAALAYYSAVSIAPLVQTLAALAATVSGPDTAVQHVQRLAAGVMGPEAAAFVVSLVERSAASPPSALARLAGLAVLLWGSTHLFIELESSLNTIWGFPTPKPSLRRLLSRRLTALALVATLGFLVLVSLAFTAGVNRLVALPDVVGAGGTAVRLLVRLWLQFVGAMALFALMYKVFPAVRVPWGAAWRAGAFTSVLFTIGAQLLSALVGDRGAPYGAAGSLVVYLLWVYGAAQVFLMGAELAQVRAEQTGVLAPPPDY